MMEHKYIGRCALITKAVIWGALVGIAGQVQAAPADTYTDALLEALAAAEGAWADSLLDQPSAATPYDEQIFTELSPILDSPQGVKLPQDQQLTD